ncbi:hypothetical protein GZ77_02370 [Endozoicomonas montiporae]|uniref:Uncharacterized protein n=2 Tax=Endozoicomonas montiporae TaxID=1027273 RepID=A0A081NAM8_9GAMM|nr:hypothetical protein GZ77_02370 [Endozoicomonas montiporae]
MHKARQRISQFILGKRTPVRQVTLDQRRIYILPSLPGMIWLLVALLLFLMAVNYVNSLALAMAFFMVSLFMLAIFHTWRNLAGLTIRSLGGEAAHVGQAVRVTVEIEGHDRERVAIKLGWPEHEYLIVDTRGATQIDLHVTGHQRGWLAPGLLRIESLYPLGLCKTWSWQPLDTGVLVFPLIDDGHPLPSSRNPDGSRAGTMMSGLEEFAGVRRYQAGDSSGHVDWKGYARRHELNTKTFDQPAGQDCVLSLNDAPGYGVEAKLSVLTGWCLRCERQKQPYGLELPGVWISPATGQRHLYDCLQSLSLFQTDLDTQNV